RWQQIALLIGVAVSVISIGAALIGMNKALESFQAMTAIPLDPDRLPDGVAIQSKGFDRDQITVTREHGPATTQNVRNYWLLNALGSKTLPDGKYLYNPETRRTEVQWIQGLGSASAPAPQARLMATVISGILNQRLPWGLVMLGVFLVVGVELLGIRSLSFAVGFYISIGTTCAMFIGGIIRWLVERSSRKAGQAVEESEVSPGSLYASGLIAAGGIVGLLGIAVKLAETWHWIPEGALAWGNKLPWMASGSATGHWISVVMFLLLALSAYYFAKNPLQGPSK